MCTYIGCADNCYRLIQRQWVRVRVSYRFRAIASPVMPAKKIVAFAQAFAFMRVMQALNN